MLTAQRVREIFNDCLFNSPITPFDYLPAESCLGQIGFNPNKIKEHAKEIKTLLLELPEDFQDVSEGEGMSFLAACRDKHGNQWAEQKDVDMLFTLGQASGYITVLLPRNMWPILPGGVPYFCISEKQKMPKVQTHS